MHVETVFLFIYFFFIHLFIYLFIFLFVLNPNSVFSSSSVGYSYSNRREARNFRNVSDNSV